MSKGRIFHLKLHGKLDCSFSNSILLGMRSLLLCVYWWYVWSVRIVLVTAFWLWCSAVSPRSGASPHSHSCSVFGVMSSFIYSSFSRQQLLPLGIWTHWATFTQWEVSFFLLFLLGIPTNRISSRVKIYWAGAIYHLSCDILILVKTDLGCLYKSSGTDGINHKFLTWIWICSSWSFHKCKHLLFKICYFLFCGNSCQSDLTI